MYPLIRTVVGLLVGWLLTHLHLESNAEQKRSSRRNFIRNAALGAVAVVLAETGVGLYEFIYPNKTGAFGKTLTVAKSDVPKVEATPYTDIPGKFYVIHNHDGVMALYWRCVHLGCTVPWKENGHRFHCPCHGSIYDYDGQRVSGPAPRSLDYFPVTALPNGDLNVNTGKILHRALYNPKQATPYKF